MGIMARTIFTGPTPPQPADLPPRTSFGEGLSAVAEMIRRQAVEEQFAKISQLGLAAQGGVNPFQDFATTGPQQQSGPRQAGAAPTSPIDDTLGRGTAGFQAVSQADSPREQFLASIRNSGIEIRPEFHDMIQGFLEKLPGPVEPEFVVRKPGDVVQVRDPNDPTGALTTVPGGQALPETIDPQVKLEADARLNASVQIEAGNIQGAAKLLIESGGNNLGPGVTLLNTTLRDQSKGARMVELSKTIHDLSLTQDERLKAAEELQTLAPGMTFRSLPGGGFEFTQGRTGLTPEDVGERATARFVARSKEDAREAGLKLAPSITRTGALIAIIDENTDLAGVRGTVASQLGQLIAQVSPESAERFVTAVTSGASRAELERFRKDVELGIAQAIPTVVGEDSAKVSDIERAITAAFFAVLDPTADAVAVTAALMQLQSAQLLGRQFFGLKSGKLQIVEFDAARGGDQNSIDQITSLIDELGEAGLDVEARAKFLRSLEQLQLNVQAFL